MDLVSIIIPTYGGSQCLKRAISSVLIQTYSNIEIIVVDDNDSNSVERKRTELLIEELNIYNLKYIKHEKNKNGAAARNTGIKESKGKYVSFLDDDDYMLPNRVECAVEYLEQNPQYSGVCCGVFFVNDDCITGEKNIHPDLRIVDFLLNDNTIGTGSNIFLTKQCVNKVGLFDESFIRHQDVEYMIRVLEKGKIAVIDKAYLVKCRCGNDNTPNYSKMLIVKQLFEEKFGEYINKLDKEEKYKYYEQRSLILFNIALTEDREKLIEAKTTLLKYRQLTVKEHIKYYLSYMGVMRSSWYKYLKQKIKKKIYRNSWDKDSVMYKLYNDIKI